MLIVDLLYQLLINQIHVFQKQQHTHFSMVLMKEYLCFIYVIFSLKFTMGTQLDA